MQTKSNYRPEIDGLRAIAVLFVIVYHAGFGKGGFLGVDVFFVISGFLISSIIIKEQSEATFTVRSFMDRRLRRILPALFFICFACITPAWVLLPPSDFKDFTESIFANLLINANHLFLSEAGYFDQASEMKPLLHTWSLSVELQFYCLVAITAAIYPNLNRSYFFAIFLLASITSTYFFLTLFEKNPDAVFYILPTRLWEFSIGIFTAIRLSDRKPIPSWLSTLGLILLVAALSLYGLIDLPQPIMTLITVIATAVIILSAKPNSTTTKLLSTPALVGIGTISYSLYLIHNPIYSFGRYASLMDKNWYLIATFTAMILLAFLSWKFIEKPFRNRKRIRGSTFYSICALSFVCALGLGLVSDKTDGFLKIRLKPQQARMQSTAKQDKRAIYCQTGGENYRKPANPCVLNNSNSIPPTWAVFGDSHAGAVAYAIADSIEAQYGEATQWLSMRGAPPEKLTNNPTPSQNWINEALTELNKNTGIHTVIVVYRLNVYFYGSQVDAYPLTITSSQKEKRQYYWDAFEFIISSFIQSGKRVIVLSPTPEPRKNIRDLIFQEGDKHNTISSVSTEHWSTRNKFTLQELEQINEKVDIFYTDDVFCDKRECYAVQDGNSYYYDHNHLSAFGAKKLAQHFIKWEEAAKAEN